MGFFDWFEPSGFIDCATCGEPLSEWQGKDGPCGLFVWRQGTAAPVDQRVDAEAAIEAEPRAQLRLPTDFVIYDFCSTGHKTWLTCTTQDGVWTGTSSPAAHAPASKFDTRADRRARRRE